MSWIEKEANFKKDSQSEDEEATVYRRTRRQRDLDIDTRALALPASQSII